MAKGKMDLSCVRGQAARGAGRGHAAGGIRVLAQALMESEVSGLIGAERYERNAERVRTCNGYGCGAGTRGWGRSSWRSRRCVREVTSPRCWSRGGERSERCKSVVQEAYVHGVSTRKVDDLLKALGMDGMSKSESRGSAWSSTVR